MLQANLYRCLHLVELIWNELVVLACPDPYVWDLQMRHWVEKKLEIKIKIGVQLTVDGIQWDLLAKLILLLFCTFYIFLQSFPPWSLSGSQERQIRLTLQSKQSISSYIPNSVGYLLWKSPEWPAFPCFPEFCPISANFLLCFFCMSLRFKFMLI